MSYIDIDVIDIIGYIDIDISFIMTVSHGHTWWSQSSESTWESLSVKQLPISPPMTRFHFEN